MSLQGHQAFNRKDTADDPWVLNVGYTGGAIARIRCTSRDEADVARIRITEAASSGGGAFVGVTDDAVLSVEGIQFVFLERD